MALSVSNRYDWKNEATIDSQEKDDNDVRVVRGINGTNKIDAWKSFEDVRCHFPSGLVDILTDGKVANFSKPTSVQAYTWPSLMAGEDVIGIAKTGSGKTLAFLLPGFIRVKKESYDAYRMGPRMLILAPTRELCQQIYEESEKFGQPAGICSVCAYGGTDRHSQLRKFRQGPHVAIACPGRFLDYLEKAQVRINNADYFVLDEADRMLDMGFEPQIRSILKYLPEVRQSCLFSATWPRDVQQVARSICWKDSVHIQVGTADSLTANKDITQHIFFVNGQNDKWRHLEQVFHTITKCRHHSSVLVFSNTKRGCADLARGIQYNLKWPASALHGDMDQRARDFALQRFKDGKDLVMVATDVAQRGLDVRNVGAVVNWDAPSNPEDYVHRIGRTGRAGERGNAYSFLFRDEGRMAREIMKLMMKAGQQVPDDLKEVAGNCPVQGNRGYDRGKNSFGKGKSGKGGKNGKGGHSGKGTRDFAQGW